MRAFADLYTALDETTKTNAKVDALAKYFRAVPAEDAVWAIHFLIGRRIKRLIETRKLVAWAIEEAGIPEWIFSDCYAAVGDLAETIALLLPSPIATTDKALRYWVEDRLLPLRQADHGRVPGGRLSKPGGAGTCRGFRHPRRSDFAPHDGRLDSRSLLL
jgi:DNA ligase-1